MSREISVPYVLCNLCIIEHIVIQFILCHTDNTFDIRQQHARYEFIESVHECAVCTMNKYFIKITCMLACKRPHSGKQAIHMTVQALIGTNISIHRSVYLVLESIVADSSVVFYPFCGFSIDFYLYILFIYSAGPNRIALRRFANCFPTIWKGKSIKNIYSNSIILLY